MKKFISMFAFVAAIVLGAFTLASCGDDDDTPELNKYKFSVEFKDFQTIKELYPDLSLTYTLPGKGTKTVVFTTSTINVEETSTEAGDILFTFNGNLDASKVDPAKTYSFQPNVRYSFQVNGKTTTSTDVPGYSTRTGQQLLDSFSKLSLTCKYSIK